MRSAMFKNTILFVFLLIIQGFGQTMSGKVLNYSVQPAEPVEGIEVYLNSILQDTTDIDGVFGFVTALSDAEISIVPREFSLKLFPNPFNPSTILKYTLPYQSTVTITMYNLLGQIIMRKQFDNQAAGVYQFRIEADQLKLSSQVLFFQVEMDPAGTAMKPGVKRTKGIYCK